MFTIIRALRGTASLNKMVKLVEELLGGAVDLGVGLAHVLVQRLVRVNGTLQVGDVGAGGVRAELASGAPFRNVLGILKSKLLGF